MHIFQIVLAIYGLAWLLLFLAVSIIGGRIVVEIKNPITKKTDSIVNVIFKKNNNDR